MPNVVLLPGVIIFVTGANGLIASHIVDQLLARGYHVRGSVRNVEKMAWLKDYFDGKYKDVRFEMVGVPDMVADGCYDGLLDGEYPDAQTHQESPN
jgi:nucleoside-diphosphate-sugar epimerase